MVLICLWAEGADPHFQAMYCTWSLGSVVAPFIIRPFLGETESAGNVTNITSWNSEDRDQESYNPAMGYSFFWNADSFTEKESRIEIAYIIVACFVFGTALASLMDRRKKE